MMNKFLVISRPLIAEWSAHLTNRLSIFYARRRRLQALRPQDSLCHCASFALASSGVASRRCKVFELVAARAWRPTCRRLLDCLDTLLSEPRVDFWCTDTLLREEQEGEKGTKKEEQASTERIPVSCKAHMQAIACQIVE